MTRAVALRQSALVIPAIALTLLLSGCLVGPDHVRPVVDTGDSYLQAPSASDPAAAPAPETDAAFWRDFDDARLAGLVEDALRANHDLRVALARLDAARAMAQAAGLDRLPQVTGQAGASDTRSSRDQAPGLERSQRDVESHDVGVGAAWELDLFGRVRRGVQSERARSQAAAYDLAALQVVVAADVAQAYFELRGRQAQLALARGNAANQRGSLDLVTARLDAGVGSEFDLARARAQWESTRARLPTLEADVAATMHRIAVLTGRAPAALGPALDDPRPLPETHGGLGAGLPSELLRRRPDIAAAEARLESATAQVGVATADLFPRFTLGGLIGSQASDLDALFSRGSESRRVALGVDWSFLDSGRVRARIAAAQAGADQQLAQYQQTVLLALEETENALARQHSAGVEQAHLRSAAEAARQGAALANLRFEGGLVDFLAVLDAERVRLQADDDFAQGQARWALARVAVYRALAGGWPDRQPDRQGPG